MPKPILIRSSTHAYHVTSRCNNKKFFQVPLSEVWKIFLKELERAHDNHDLQVHAFVLMDNHFHLLCHTPQANIDQIMRNFLRDVAKEVNRRAGVIDHLWGSRYKWSIINSERYYFQVYKYILQNPVRANLVGRVQDYPYSSLNSRLPFKPVPFMELNNLKWLNQPFQKNTVPLVRLGLKKAQFGVSAEKKKVLEKENGPKGNEYLLDRKRD